MTDEVITEEITPVVVKQDFYIKLPSEDDFPTVFAEFYTQDIESTVDALTGDVTDTPVGDPYLVAHTVNYSIDLVGTIYAPTGVTVTDDEGFEYPETAPVDGYHVNVRWVGGGRDAIEAIDEQYGMEPATPYRTFL